MTDRAIVTAISPNMWYDYLVFYDSLRRLHDYPIYAICLEMSDWHLDILRQQKNVHVIVIGPDQIEEYKAFNKHWRQWFKPFYLEMIPEHDTVLWLDVDMVIMDSLEPLFEHTQRRFLVVADYFAPKTCMNQYELYKKFRLDIPREKANIVLNSGVVGFKPARDKEILKHWRRKVAIAAQDEEVAGWIALFDQGALLWTLQELGLYDNILAKKGWNYPALKHPYELASDSIEAEGLRGPRDVIDEIRLDNPTATIAHFAGLPKLAHLAEVNHPHSRGYFRRKNGNRDIRRVFVVGVEGSGLRTMAEILRRSIATESWVRHSLHPTLAREVNARHFGADFQTDDYLKRLGVFERQDCGLVCEANKNLSFFVKEIQQRLGGNAKFLVMLRDPVNLLRSRLLQFVTWPEAVHTAPPCYRDDYRHFVEKTGDNSNNYFRCRPHDNRLMNLIDLHLWEIEHTLKTVMTDLQNFSDQNHRVVWLENVGGMAHTLSSWVGGGRIDPAMAQKMAKQKYSFNTKEYSQETADWVEDQIYCRMAEIYERVGAVVRSQNLNMPYMGV